MFNVHSYHATEGEGCILRSSSFPIANSKLTTYNMLRCSSESALVTGASFTDAFMQAWGCPLPRSLRVLHISNSQLSFEVLFCSGPHEVKPVEIVNN